MLALMLPRRIACNALAILRARTPCEVRRGLSPWRAPRERLRHAVLAAQDHGWTDITPALGGDTGVRHTNPSRTTAGRP